MRRGSRRRTEELVIAGHPVVARSVDGDAAVLTFEDLCAQPLGIAQYLELAKRLRAVTLAAVPRRGA